jgi:hypothetical protein
MWWRDADLHVLAVLEIFRKKHGSSIPVSWDSYSRIDSVFCLVRAFEHKETKVKERLKKSTRRRRHEIKVP